MCGGFSRSQALQIGTIASRDYLRAREDVYLAALTVTDARNPFRTKWSLGGSLGLVDDDTLNEKLDDALLLSGEEFVPDGIETFEGVADVLLGDGARLHVTDSLLSFGVIA